MSQTKTKREILIETVEYYGYDVTRRATEKSPSLANELLCVYQTEDGRQCAVGRCLMDPDQAAKYRMGVSNLVVELGEIDSLLKPEYRGHSIVFWKDLQTFHDNPDNWVTPGEEGPEFTATGLTPNGQAEYQVLWNRYKEG